MDHAQDGLNRLPGSWRRWLVPCLIALACLPAARFYDSGRLGTSIRLPATVNVQTLAAEDLPAPIENDGDGSHVWALRSRADPYTINPAFAEAIQFIKDSPKLLSARPQMQPLRGLAPLFAPDGAQSPSLFVPLAQHGEALDPAGQPLRWLVPENIIAAYSVPRAAPFSMPARTVKPQFEAALARLRPSRNAADYRSLVESFANRYGLNTNLVMAIIHSESNFSPTLVSPKSAMGLMQLLPSTASDEVHRFLYGTRGNVSFDQLANPEINIRYGTAYLHILNNRYFQNVNDRQVREACVIAAYNMGPNGFLRLYGSSPELAVQKINSMTPDEFHEDLQRRLPMRETRFYVEKVKRMKEHYAGSQ